jgi:hypothetical protein
VLTAHASPPEGSDIAWDDGIIELDLSGREMRVLGGILAKHMLVWWHTMADAMVQLQRRHLVAGAAPVTDRTINLLFVRNNNVARE